jgi:hypothetical protein
MQVFLSYSVEDRASAARLADALRDVGLTVWTPDQLAPGENWAAAMGQALEQSEVMVVLFTKDARHSPMLKEEVQFALTGGNYRGRVIPVLVNLPSFQAGADVPWILLHFPAISVAGNPPDFSPVAEKVMHMARGDAHASA